MVAIGIRVEDPETGVMFERTFPRLPVRIGRSPLNDLQLESPAVSGFHAVLEEHQGRVMLRDLGSTNGTRVREGLKGDRVAPNQLLDLEPFGDRFVIWPVFLSVYSIAPGSVDEPSGPRAPLMATSTMLRQGVDIPAPSAATQTQDFRARLDTLANSVAASRDADHSLMNVLGAAIDSVAADARGAFAEQVVRRFPDLRQRPDSLELLGRYSTNSVLPSTSPELLVEAVKEMAVQRSPHLGAPETPEQLATFLSQVNDTLQVFLECFLQLREGSRQLEDEFGLRDNRRSAEADQFVGGADAAQLATGLFNWMSQDFSAARHLRSAFADLMIQQIAMVNGVKRGAKSVVEELSPDSVEAEAKNPRNAASGWLTGRYRSLWSLYCRRHEDLAEDERLFRVLFGSAFAQGFTDVRNRPSDPPGAPSVQGAVTSPETVRSTGSQPGGTGRQPT